MRGPWKTAPLWLAYKGPSEPGQASVFGPWGSAVYAGRFLAPVDPITWGEPRPPRFRSVEYENEQGTDPAGGPRIAVLLHSFSAGQTGAGSMSVYGGHTSSDFDYGMALWTGPVQAGAFEPVTLFEVQTSADSSFVLAVTAGDVVFTSYTGLVLEAAWVYQPPRYRYVTSEVPPLHQRQRPGLHSSQGTRSRGFARGIY